MMKKISSLVVSFLLLHCAIASVAAGQVTGTAKSNIDSDTDTDSNQSHSQSHSRTNFLNAVYRERQLKRKRWKKQGNDVFNVDGIHEEHHNSLHIQAGFLSENENTTILDAVSRMNHTKKEHHKKKKALREENKNKVHSGKSDKSAKSKRGKSSPDKVREGSGNGFVCPKHSDPKRDRNNLDSFDDCECVLGYERKENSCTAQEGLCTKDYFKMVRAKQEDTEHWIEMARGATTEEQTYEYLQKMNSALSTAWGDYNRGKASCEMFVFDDDENVEDGQRRLKCCSRLRRAVETVAGAFVTVVKAVVKVVVEVVEIVVDVVVEIVECGVGIATQGAKCGLIGCAFGLFGVAADIAFTLATGGTTKIASTACALSEDEDDEDDNDNKKKSGDALSALLEGVGLAVCEINNKIESPALGTVCDFVDVVESVVDPLVFIDLLVQNDVVFRFITAFRDAMCGNPGSALLDLLEEIVTCEIGCEGNVEDNVFCTF